MAPKPRPPYASGLPEPVGPASLVVWAKSPKVECRDLHQHYAWNSNANTPETTL